MRSLDYVHSVLNNTNEIIIILIVYLNHTTNDIIIMSI